IWKGAGFMHAGKNWTTRNPWGSSDEGNALLARAAPTPQARDGAYRSTDRRPRPREGRRRIRAAPTPIPLHIPPTAFTRGMKLQFEDPSVARRSGRLHWFPYGHEPRAGYAEKVTPSRRKAASWGDARARAPAQARIKRREYRAMRRIVGVLGALVLALAAAVVSGAHPAA